MTLDMIRETIKRLVGWISELKNSRTRGDREAAEQAETSLTNRGVKISGKKSLDLSAVPTINGVHVQSGFINELRKICNQFLTVYNTHLRSRGLNPVHIAI